MSYWCGVLQLFALLATAYCACPASWIRHSHSCYAYSNTSVTFKEAVEYCEAYGANLAEIETKAEDDRIKGDLRKHNIGSVWIGANDKLVEGLFVWDRSQKPFTFSDWGPGQPDSWKDQNEDCVVMYKPFDYQWGDILCDQNNGVVCEKPYE